MNNSFVKKLMVLNGSHSDIPLIQKGKELGLYVITLGNNKDMIGHKYADKHIDVDFSDVDLVFEAAKNEKIDYICSCANDFGMISACYVAEKLNLPGHDSYDSCLKLHHKDKFKKLVNEYNLSSPYAQGFDNKKLAIDYALNKNIKLIIKPIDLSGGKGITVVESKDDKKIAIEKAFGLSKNQRIVIEDFIEGTNHTFSAFIINKKVQYFFSDNEYYYNGGYLCCTSLGPADNIDLVKDILINETEKIAKILNLVDGRFHIQYRLDKNNKPWIIEITRRMSGDFFSLPVKYALGLDDSLNIVKAECGMDLSNIPYMPVQNGYVGRHCIMTPKNGIVNNYEIDSSLKEYILEDWIWFNQNYEVSDYMKDKFGVIVFGFKDKVTANKFIPNIFKFININYI